MADPALYLDFLVALMIPTFAVLYSAAKDDRVALMSAHDTLLEQSPESYSEEDYDQVHWITGLASRETWALAGILLSVVALTLAMFESAIGKGIPTGTSFPGLLAFLVVQVSILLMDEHRATRSWRQRRRELDRRLKPGWARRVGRPRFK